MILTRRLILNTILTTPLLSTISLADSIMTLIPERSLGKADAPVVVEWFSFTCVHCAHFNKTVFPKIKSELIDTGKIRYVFKDMPLDKLALIASMISRQLPEDKYLAFVDTLLSTQDIWAFGADINNPLEKLTQQAIMAGLSKKEVDNIINNENLMKAFISKSESDQNKYNLTGTPSFLFPSGKVKSGALTYDDFVNSLK